MCRLLTAVFLAAAVLLPAGCKDSKTSAPGGSAATANRKAYPRDEFEKMVIGKPVNEIISTFGQPDRRVPMGNDEELTYANVTTNGAKTDLSARVKIVNGKGAKVEYSGD